MTYLTGTEREVAAGVIRSRHYMRSVPSGKSHYYAVGEALVVYSIPANKNLGRFLVGNLGPVWELSRLWAPDGHEANLLTRAIAEATDDLRVREPDVVAVVSFADPNVGHKGGVYRAASWVFTGQSEEGRYYTRDGVTVSRRAFHSGGRSLTKREILALGYTEEKRPGKLRFARGLTKKARRVIHNKFGRLEGA